MKNFNLLMVVAWLFVGCGSTRQIRIATNEGEAEVFVGGISKGRTPATLLQPDVAQHIEGGRFQVTLKQPGYKEKTLLLNFAGDSEAVIRMEKIDAEDFSDRFLRDHLAEANKLIRELLTCQGLIFAQKFDEAAESLKKIQSKYPMVASAYVLDSNIMILQDRLDLALASLKRAIELDPSDTAAERLWHGLRQRRPAALPAEGGP